MVTAARLRITRDLDELDLPGCISVKELDGCVHMGREVAALISVQIKPADGPYQGGVFDFVLAIPLAYPFEGPRVRCEQRILHPNVHYETGSVCMNVFRLDWSPALSLHAVLLGLLNLLLEPSGEDPLEHGKFDVLTPLAFKNIRRSR